MSGAEMLLVNMLKAFMPKEAAEKIGAMASDGTFDRIGNLPADIDEIKRGMAALHLGQAKIFAALQALGGSDALHSNSQLRLVAPVPTEHGTNAGPGNDSGADLQPDNRNANGA